MEEKPQPNLTSPGRDSPILVLGITGRSGTNYLADLLRIHPDTSDAEPPVHEDFFVAESEPLMVYLNALQHQWKRWDEHGRRHDLPAHIGDALLEFAGRRADRRLILKTPSIRHLDAFPVVFPSAHAVIIVRDPRSVVESATTSFGGTHEKWAYTWARAATRLARSLDSDKVVRSRSLVIRYEDLFVRNREVLTSVLTHLHLDVDSFDFDAAANLPTRGSSQSVSPSGDVHWEPVHKDSAFDPLKRWEAWSAARLERVEWIARQNLERFGYARSGQAPKFSDRALHAVRDLKLLSSIGAQQLNRVPKRGIRR